VTWRWISILLLFAASALAQSGAVCRGKSYGAVDANFTRVAENEFASLDQAALRKHAWVVFSSVTEPINSSCDVSVWETWYAKEELGVNTNLDFRYGPSRNRWRSRQALNTGKARALHENAQVPQGLQFTDGTIVSHPVQIGDQDTSNFLFSDEMYNPATQATIAAQKLNSGEEIQNLWKQGTHSLNLPTSAVVVKPIWTLLKKPTKGPPRLSGCLVVPVWNEARLGRYRQNGGDGGIEFADYDRVIIWHPNVPSSQQINQCNGVTASVVPYTEFKWRDVVMRQALASPVLPHTMTSGNPGDIAILLGMHVATREIDSWTWSTFWWADDTQRAIKGYGNDRPDLSDRPAYWSNYLMDTTITATSPIFNPYLEAVMGKGQILGGTSSNCLACHSRATYPSICAKPNGSGDLLDFRVIESGLPDPSLTNARLVTFLWSLRRQVKDPYPSSGTPQLTSESHCVPAN